MENSQLKPVKLCLKTNLMSHSFSCGGVIYIYIYSHPQTNCFVVSQLFSVARHVGRLKLGSKPSLEGLFTFCLTGYQSVQFVRRALHYVSGSRKFLCQSVQPPWGEHIYLCSSRADIIEFSVPLTIHTCHLSLL